MKQISNHLLVTAIGGALALGVTAAHATDFDVTATVENTVTVTKVNDMDLGRVFATQAGVLNTEGVGAFKLAPAGTVAPVAGSATVKLLALGGAVPARASVAASDPFTVTLPDPVADEADFVADAGASLAALKADAIELKHSSLNPSVASLYLVDFTLGAPTGGTATVDGVDPWKYDIVPSFGQTEVSFSIGATVITEPAAGAGNNAYQAGTYTGTFEVTATY
jgi:hypothetical protein